VKLKRAIFVSSTEAPGRHDRVAFLQSTEPQRKDCYVADLWLGPLGVMAGEDVYPMHMFRRLTVDGANVARHVGDEPVSDSVVVERDAFLAAMSGAVSSDLAGLAARESSEPAKRRGRPSKPKE